MFRFDRMGLSNASGVERLEAKHGAKLAFWAKVDAKLTFWADMD